MPRRSCRVAAVALAAVTSFPFDASSDPGPLQDARRARWALALQAQPVTSADQDARPKPAPADAAIGWVKASDPGPECGVRLELDRDLALYADWDRYRTRLPQVRETVDTILVGLRFRFP